MNAEKNAVATVAELMVLAARTAPKGRGIDTILCKVLTGKEIKAVAKRLAELGEAQNISFFLRDSKNFAGCDGCVLIGAKGNLSVGINCGACGFLTCAGMAEAYATLKEQDTFYSGPNCAVRMTDLGIAIGSAVKTAQIHNVDNRIMFSGGAAALDLGLFDKECTVAYAIPLSATGKNIFFDRDSAK